MYTSGPAPIGLGIGVSFALAFVRWARSYLSFCKHSPPNRNTCLFQEGRGSNAERNGMKRDGQNRRWRRRKRKRPGRSQRGR